MGCRTCDSVDVVEVPEQSLEAYMEGAADIQVAFPSMGVRHRELLMQARRRRRGRFHWYLCPTCWEAL
ncbi:hypothetical protein [uncultured Mediterranean phage uvDeep-CGR2-AD7-C12]|nr:hypothetical protein [uncultured Mediterranean phage uvDeep-CGR2-AD7-C12]